MDKQKVLRSAKEVVVWILSLLLVVVFVRAGLAKFSDTSGWARAFAIWGYPVWFRVAVGIAELTAAALLLLPRTAAGGAVVIIAVMLGGMVTHVIHHHPEQMTNELGQIVFATVILIARWPWSLRRQRLQATRGSEGTASP